MKREYSKTTISLLGVTSVDSLLSASATRNSTEQPAGQEMGLTYILSATDGKN